jgi:hypothetical protein
LMSASKAVARLSSREIVKRSMECHPIGCD